MGDAANPIVHRKRFMGGRMTPEEVHRKLTFGDAKCDGCGAPPAIRISIYVLLSDMSMDTRMAIEWEIAQKRMRTTPMKGGPAVCTSRMHACERCSPELEKAAARGPSYAIVDIMRGPGPDAPLIQVVSG